MSEFNLRSLILCLALTTPLTGCSYSKAEQPPPIVTSYTPEYVQTHRFICKTFDAEFSLRSKGPTKSGPTEVSFEFAKFNGQMIDAAQEVHSVFEMINHTELISGECLEQTSSIGAVISAVTKTGEMPRIRLYVDFAKSGVSLYELVCPVEKELTELPNQFAGLCTAR